MSIFKRNQKKCSVVLDNTYNVKGWSNCHMAPIVTVIKDLQVYEKSGKYISALISHINCNKSSSVKQFVRDELAKANEKPTFGSASYDYLIVVSDKFKMLPRKQKLVLLLLESCRAEGIDTTEFDIGTDSAETSEYIEALIKASNMFGKWTVNGAIKKARKTIDNSCYKASSHKFFQRAPKKVYDAQSEQQNPTSDPTSEQTKTDTSSKAKTAGATV